MKKIIGYLATLFLVLLIYCVTDYLSGGAINAGIFKYITILISISCAILLQKIIEKYL